MASKTPICQIASCEGSKKLCVPIGIWAFLCPHQHGWPPWPPPLGHSLWPRSVSALCTRLPCCFLATKKLFFSFSRLKPYILHYGRVGCLLVCLSDMDRYLQQLGTTKNLLFTHAKWLHQFINGRWFQHSHNSTYAILLRQWFLTFLANYPF